MSGYTQTELDDIQAKWSLRFPSDLIELLRQRRRVIDQGEKFRSFDWLEASDDKIRERLEWPFEGFLFDVENGLWWPEWGDRPSEQSAREEILRAVFSEAPKVIPLYGHRYIPEEPHEAGNPIFSIWQMDVICYGMDLTDYINRENYPFGGGSSPSFDFDWSETRKIRFWTRAVEFNKERFATHGSFVFLNKNKLLPEA